MKTVYLIIVSIFLCFQSYSQEFNELYLNDFTKYSFQIFNDDGLGIKVIFSEPANSVSPQNININTLEVGTLVAFSKETFLYKSIDFEKEIPYLKILLNGEELWVKGSDCFVFNKDLPDTSFNIYNTDYNVFLAGNIKYSNTDSIENYYSYIGYRLFVIENTMTNQYYFIKINNFPEELEGHSYKTNFVYLQDDFGVNEEISDLRKEKNYVELIISAKYQDGSAKYSIIFYPYSSNIPVKITSIQLEY